jgi:predicted aldo/keto reductase-like oxidoreductase
MKPARFAASLVVAIALGGLAGCDDDSAAGANPELVAECKKLEAHIIQITPARGGGPPETDPKRVEELVAKLPIEDIQQCAAVKDRKVIACMMAATDVAKLRACIPAQTE